MEALALAVAIPITAYLLHKFPVTITIHRKHELIEPPHPATVDIPGDAEEDKSPIKKSPDIANFVAAFNEVFNEIGGDDDGK